MGTAPTGGVWTFSGSAADLSVAGGTGNIKMAAGKGLPVYLTSVSRPETDTRLTFGLDKAATGGGVQVSAYGRRVAGQGGYAGKAKLSSTGAVNVELVRQNGSGVETVIQTAVGTGSRTRWGTPSICGSRC